MRLMLYAIHLPLPGVQGGRITSRNGRYARSALGHPGDLIHEYAQAA
jgi:hypothetical protein